MSNTTHPLFNHHQVSTADLAVLAAMREQTAPFKGMVNGPEARESYDQILEAVPAGPGVQYQADIVGGIPGVWCRLESAPSATAMLYLHGGGYVMGSATAYRHFAGQFAARSGMDVFVADYGLAPEHAFPTALNHAMAAYSGLVEAGYRKIVVVGDSAGGGLTLSLLAKLVAEADELPQPVAAVVMSPWTDLALTGDSLESRAEEEMYLSPDAVQAFANHFLAGHSPLDAAASPLYGSHKDLPPLQLHVGTAEILLSDSLAYVERAREAGAAIEAHLWQAMPHVFPNAFAFLEGAENAMGMMAEFIRRYSRD